MKNDTRLTYICKLANAARADFFNRKKVANILNTIDIVARGTDDLLAEPRNLKQIKDLAGDNEYDH